MDLTCLTNGNLDDRVGNEANTDTRRDRVGERHEGDGEESRNCELRILPIDFQNLSHHQEANEDQSGRSSLGRNKLNEGRQEGRQQEEDTGDNRGQTRTRTFTHT